MNNDSFINETLKNAILNNQPGTFFRRKNDDKQAFLKVSKNWKNLVEHSNEDIKSNNSFYESIFHEDREMVFQHIKNSVQQKSQWKLNYRIITKDGLTKWVEEIGIPIFDENNALLFFDGYISEIIKEKFEIQKFLAVRNAINSYSIVSKIDLEGNIISVNDLFCFHSKYTIEELIGQNLRLINSGYHPKAFFEDLWDTILSKKVWQGEIKNRNKDGIFYWVDMVISPILNDEGDIEQFFSISTIITEKKQNEFLLRNIYNGLTVKTGEMFFLNLTAYCCKNFDVAYTFIAWFDEINDRAETISFHNGDMELDNICYVLVNTPCKDVKNGEIVTIAQNVQKKFPGNKDLERLKIESYLGIPISNDFDQVIGILVLMDTKPMLDAFDKEFALISISVRIGNELTKFLLEKDKKQIEEYTEHLLASLGSQICVMYETGEILSISLPWDKSLIPNGNSDLRITNVGSNYIANLLKIIKQTGDKIALEIYNGIEAILNNQINDFQIEFTYHAPGQDRCFLLSVTRFFDSNDKLVLSQIEIKNSKALP